ncbi:MAG TPA: ribonuclease HI family protein [Candidatus Marinimicrobia bacterium]|nr:ribonuclease HI family protein [Candidatus Neomarinimicrobiota bacterium]
MQLVLLLGRMPKKRYAKSLYVIIMKLNQQEINQLKNLLSDEKYRINEVLDNLYKKMSINHEVNMFIDGAADLNSKTAGIGGVITKNGKEIFSFSEYLDDATNNEAEYTALIKGLEYLIKLNILSINIYSDSELVVKQISGEYKVKNPRMRALYQKAINLLGELEHWTITHVFREQNEVADLLAKSGRQKREK